MKHTKIIATVGPGHESRETHRALVEAGVDVFRINFSHGDEAQRSKFLQDIREVEREVGRTVVVYGDLCGPKIRVGMIADGEVELQAGRDMVIQRAPVDGTAACISTTLPELVDVVQTGERIRLADGRLLLEVVKTSPPESFTCRVIVGGPLSNGKGVNLPETQLPISALTEKDREDVRWIAQRDFDYVGLSFVQRAEDIDELRGLLETYDSRAHIIAKIEKPQALSHIDAIIATVDAVMVARGDLGVEMDFPTVPITQKRIADKCRVAGKPCIIATEMLESMIKAPRPTRAEVSDVANAVFDHADAVMLSAESSIGKYPLEAVDAMHRVVVAAEAFEFENHGRVMDGVTLSNPITTAALAASVHQIMRTQPIAAIALFTATGTTARLLAKNRPACPILALASQQSVARRTCLYYGVIPRVVEQPASVEQLVQQSVSLAQALNLAVSGDHIIVLAGNPVGAAGGTKVLIVEQIP